MELRHLRYFIAVAEELSFSRAAEKLNMAQPPLSHQIRALEIELDVLLFERAQRRIFLTDPGKLFLARARAILAQVDSARIDVRKAAHGEIGSLAVGYTASSMFARFLPQTLQRFRANHPRVTVSLHEMASLDQVHALNDRMLDLGILRWAASDAGPQLRFDTFRSTRLTVVLASDHPLASRASLSIADLHAESFITYPRGAGTGLYQQILDLCRNAGYRPTVIRESREASEMVGLAASGVGIAIMPDDVRCIDIAGAAYRPLSDPQAVSTLSLAYRRNDANPHLQTLIRLLTQQATASVSTIATADEGPLVDERKPSKHAQSRPRLPRRS